MINKAIYLKMNLVDIAIYVSNPHATDPDVLSLALRTPSRIQCVMAKSNTIKKSIILL